MQNIHVALTPPATPAENDLFIPIQNTPSFRKGLRYRWNGTAWELLEPAKTRLNEATIVDVKAITDDDEFVLINGTNVRRMAVQEILDEIITASGGLDTAAVDARIEQWARAGDNSQIPQSKLDLQGYARTIDIPSVRGLITL